MYKIYIVIFTAYNGNAFNKHIIALSQQDALDTATTYLSTLDKLMEYEITSVSKYKSNVLISDRVLHPPH